MLQPYLKLCVQLMDVERAGICLHDFHPVITMFFRQHNVLCDKSNYQLLKQAPRQLLACSAVT